MFGGNDGNNTVIPTSAAEYQQYATGRTPTLALAQGALLPLNVANTPGPHVRRCTRRWPGFQGLFNQGKAAVMANVGPLLAPTTRADFQARRVPDARRPLLAQRPAGAVAELDLRRRAALRLGRAHRRPHEDRQRHQHAARR